MSRFIEITGRPETSRVRIFELEMHSMINILNVIHSQLELCCLLTRCSGQLRAPIDRTSKLAEAIRRADTDTFSPEALRSLSQMVESSLDQLEGEDPELRQNSEFLEYRQIFREVFRVLEVRTEELDRRLSHPDEWEIQSVESFRQELVSFLGAIEKNSRGRYRIVYNIAEQEENDYLAHVEINGTPKETISMPLLVKDSIRDLIANARKYTPPGGRIDVGITSRNDTLRCVVEDSGVGIPTEEIPRVVEYGYRASNVMNEIRTLGSGLGLAKAHYVTDRFRGRLRIRSSVGRGTTIRIEIPHPS